MAEHPPTSIEIATLSSSRTGSHKISVFAPQKKLSVLPSDDTISLQKKPNSKKPKIHSIKKISPKIIKSLNILKQILNKIKHKNKRITWKIILPPEITKKVTS